MKRSTRIAALGATMAALAFPILAQTVKIMPLGGFDGEFCALDRALIFEDPNGTRILIDAGTTVMGGEDPRLGKIDVVLVTHTHGDHLGKFHTKAIGAGTCGQPDISVSDLPNSNSVNIALAKKSKIVVGSDMPQFFQAKLRANGGDPANVMLARFGGSVTVGGVKIATVHALHSNGLDPDYIGGELGAAMKAAGIWGDVGLATGYVLKFSNGLVTYLSGDTGIIADQEDVVRGYYNAKLVVMNIGDTFTTGPAEAAYVINARVKPRAVLQNHQTRGGTPRARERE